MKKLFASLFILVFAFAFCSCKSEQDSSKTTNTEPVKKIETTAEANAFKSIGKSEAENIAGAKISVPEKSDNVSYYLYSSGNSSYVQTSFSRDDCNYVYHVKKIDEFEDFSGLYFNWSDIRKVKIGKSDAEFRQYSSDDDSYSVLLWIDKSNGTMNTLSVDDAVSAESFVSIAAQL